MKNWSFEEDDTGCRYIIQSCETPDLTLDEIVEDFDRRFPDAVKKTIYVDTCELELQSDYKPMSIFNERDSYYLKRNYTILTFF